MPSANNLTIEMPDIDESLTHLLKQPFSNLRQQKIIMDHLSFFLIFWVIAFCVFSTHQPKNDDHFRGPITCTLSSLTFLWHSTPPLPLSITVVPKIKLPSLRYSIISRAPVGDYPAMSVQAYVRTPHNRSLDHFVTTSSVTSVGCAGPMLQLTLLSRLS